MKTLKIFMILAFGSFAMNAQDLNKDQVPNEVATAFENEYPQANDVEWEKNADYFDVEFEIDRKDHEIWYSASGEIVKHEEEVLENDLPSSITNAIASNYSDLHIEDAEMKTENGTTTYSVELENGNQEKTIIFDESGNVIKEYTD
ncbi:MAG TPA: PepSY-like domain-containing protein [Salinimicrobium sp.]|nr:PepSY-like domain-containing protein [Salinimicrobium sp.]